MAAAMPVAVSDPALSPARRVFAAIVAGLFLSTFVSDSRLAKLPLQFLLKDHLHVGPTAMAAFFGLTGLAWYFKPVAGLLSDLVPIFGSRRRVYLMLSGLGAGVCWAVLGAMPHQFGPLVWTLVAANAFAVIASSVSGGLLVEAGQRMGWTGRMGSLREVIIAGTFLMAQPIGGYLVGQRFGLTCGIGAALFLSLVPLAAWLLAGEREERAQEPFAMQLRQRLRPLGHARALWLAALFIFLKDLSPGFGTPLFYVQTNTLHFSPVFLGWLRGVGYATGILGALAYGWLCRRVPLSRLLVVSLLLSVVGTLLFLGYHSRTAAIVIGLLAGDGSGGMLSVLIGVAILDLAARAAPPGTEAVSYSLLMSASNLAGTGSDILGSWLYDKCHLPLPTLIVISAAATAAALLALPLLPRPLLAHADRAPANVAV